MKSEEGAGRPPHYNRPRRSTHLALSIPHPQSAHPSTITLIPTGPSSSRQEHMNKNPNPTADFYGQEMDTDDRTLSLSLAVVEEAIKAARRVNDYSTAVRIFEGLSEFLHFSTFWKPLPVEPPSLRN